ncbi:MAG: hypothetical protein IPL30_10150 [Elusimicrobia bacterium]|nr:hypothetical protein [Elusimicrobiota bacterium]
MKDSYIQLREVPSKDRKVYHVPLVIDVNQFNDIIGIEVIDLKFNTNAAILDGVSENLKISQPHLRCSYDETSDCFYLLMSKEHSSNQIAVDGKIETDLCGNMVGISIPAFFTKA